MQSLVIDADDPKTVYVLCRKGLAVTHDNGVTWTNATAAAPAAWVSAGFSDFIRHPARADWWYVAGQAGLYGTVDAGKTWQPAPGLVGKLWVRRLEFARGTQTLWASVWSRGLWSADIIGTPARRRAAGH